MRRGSLEYWPHRMARKPLPRMRSWTETSEPAISSLVAFKSGMTHVGIIDDSRSPSKGQEVMRPVTVLAMPTTFVYGMRLYAKKYLYTQPLAHVYDKNAAQRAGMKNAKGIAVEQAKKSLGDVVEITALVAADPSPMGIGIKKKVRFEIHVGGKTSKEKFNFLEKLLGREIQLKEVMKPGDFVDVLSITKGKGWQGPIKRFHVAKQVRKATGKVRHVGTLGAWHPAKVLFSVPQAGHLGFNYRTELNKRVLQVGNGSETQMGPAGGFLHFGPVKSEYIMIDGSVPGPAKRMVRIRKALRPSRKAVEPKVTYVSMASKQGA